MLCEFNPSKVAVVNETELQDSKDEVIFGREKEFSHKTSAQNMRSSYLYLSSLMESKLKAQSDGSFLELSFLSLQKLPKQNPYGVTQGSDEHPCIMFQNGEHLTFSQLFRKVVNHPGLLFGLDVSIGVDMPFSAYIPDNTIQRLVNEMGGKVAKLRLDDSYGLARTRWFVPEPRK